MASPPYRSPAGSPPHPHAAVIPNPKKRPSLSLASNPAPTKRRKSSFHPSVPTPGASHPLRQTSFPPDENALNGRSPSIDSDVTAVTGGRSNTNTTIGPRKRGRKKKAVEGSLKSGKAPTADGTSLKEGEEGDDDEDDDEGPEGMVDEGEKVDRVKAKENLAVLIGAFNNEQADRYDMYRRIRLRKETVRKIVNQTLSQSVPPTVITTINGFAKVFVGLIVEKARDVQQQEAGQSPIPPADRSRPSRATSRPTTSSSANVKPDPSTTDMIDDIFDLPTATQATLANSQETAVTHRKDLGPLQPDDLREALGRYLHDGEGGGAGMAGTSLGLGISGSGTARLSGRRLFT